MRNEKQFEQQQQKRIGTLKATQNHLRNGLFSRKHFTKVDDGVLNLFGDL
jgi:hypothetical protein